LGGRLARTLRTRLAELGFANFHQIGEAHIGRFRPQQVKDLLNGSHGGSAPVVCGQQVPADRPSRMPITASATKIRLRRLAGSRTMPFCTKVASAWFAVGKETPSCWLTWVTVTTGWPTSQSTSLRLAESAR